MQFIAVQSAELNGCNSRSVKSEMRTISTWVRNFNAIVHMLVFTVPVWQSSRVEAQGVKEVGGNCKGRLTADTDDNPE